MLLSEMSSDDPREGEGVGWMFDKVNPVLVCLPLFYTLFCFCSIDLS